MEEYFNKLIFQFKCATGTNHVDVHSKAFLQEFNEWIKQRQLIGKRYASFIDYMNVCPGMDFDTVEVGKGILDSIVLDTDISMITPYSDGIKRTSGGVITGDFMVFHGMPFIVKEEQESIEMAFAKRFITQNPYSFSDIDNWEQLHHSGENITIGFFGNIYDKDLESIEAQIEMLRKSMETDFKTDSVYDGDRYYFAISSDRRVKTRSKTMTR